MGGVGACDLDPRRGESRSEAQSAILPEDDRNDEAVIGVDDVEDALGLTGRAGAEPHLDGRRVRDDFEHRGYLPGTPNQSHVGATVYVSVIDSSTSTYTRTFVAPA